MEHIMQSSLHLKWNIATKRVRDAHSVFRFPGSALASAVTAISKSSKYMLWCEQKRLRWSRRIIESPRTSNFGFRIDIVVLTVNNGSISCRNQTGTAQELLR